MASTVVTSVNETTPTVIFHGQGTIAISTYGGGNLLIGGADMTQSNGVLLPNQVVPFFIRVESEDKIYGLAFTGGGTFNVTVFSCR